VGDLTPPPLYYWIKQRLETIMKTRAYITLSLLLSLGLYLCACSRKESPSPPQPPEPGKEEPKKPDNPVPKPPSKQQVHTLTIEGYSQPPSRGSLSATFSPDGLLLSYTIEVRDSNGRPKPDKSSSKVYNHVGDIIQWSGRAYTEFGSCDVVSYDYDYSLSSKGHVIRETEADIVRGAHHTNIYTWRGSQIQRIDHILTNEQRARQWIIYEYSGKDVITKLYEETSPRPVWTRRSRYDEEHRLLSRLGWTPEGSRTAGTSYLSSGCFYCDALFGAFPIRETLTDIRVDDAVSKMLLVLRLPRPQLEVFLLEALRNAAI